MRFKIPNYRGSCHNSRKFQSEGMRIIESRIVKNKYEEDDWFRPYLWTHYDYSLDDRFLSMLRWKIKPDEIYRKAANLTENNIYKVGLDVGCSPKCRILSLRLN